MGLFGFFSNDPDKEIIKIEALLKDGDNEKALKLATRLEKKHGHLEKARSLLTASHEAMAAGFLEKASRSESAGAYGDAADWMEIALEHVDHPEKRDTLLGKVHQLRKKHDDDDRPEDVITPAQAKVKKNASQDHVEEEIHFATLVGMLEPHIAEDYEEREHNFRLAYIALNSGRPEEARAGFEALLEENPEDPVLRLERARCALILEDPETAREDLEAVWPNFGDETLDLAGSISVPYLWGDAMARMNKTLPIVERLAEQANPANNFPGLSLLYASSLEQCQRYSEAVRFLVEAVKKFEKMPDFPYLLAVVFERQKDWDQAVHCLEAAIAPSCASGGCAPVPKHLPSLRLLAKILLKYKFKPHRAGEILTHIAQATGGQLRREDYLLLAEYHSLTDDHDAAARALSDADRAVAAANEEEPVAISGPQQSDKAIL